MSFRLRLTLFFVLIVVLPMVALAVLVSEIAADSADGKADARLGAGLRTATSLFDEAQAAARPAAKRAAVQIDGDEAALAVMRAGDPGRLGDLAGQIARDQNLAAVELTDTDGMKASAGGKPVATASVRLVDGAGRPIGQVTVATTTSDAFLSRVRDATGEEAALAGPSGSAAGTVSIEAGAVPDPGGSADVELSGDQFRVASTAPLGQEETRVALFTPAGDEGFFGSRPKVALLFLGFFALAILAVLFILRSLQAYVREMLAAARRIGDGDFSSEVPVNGGDEMAGLANEFNKMSGRLSEQMDQLRRQRLEIEASVRRIGEAFASGLDRQALLKILVETAVGTCEADYGLVALSGRVGAEAEAGQAGPAMRAAALAAEGQALADPGPVEVERGSTYALSSSIGRIGGDETPVGTMTLARAGSPFTAAERDVFLYLLGQAQASIENLALHEMVSEQAVTDDLTGLANLRAFGEAMEREIARAARFGLDLSLLLLDIDDFKRVNDTYGHLQGDAVLRETAEVLDDESREIDTPARYGGEEFVIALPETDAAGARELGERIRAAIERRAVPSVEDGGAIRVTASIGVATMPAATARLRPLLGAADAALYEAKRTGKNRVCVGVDPGATQSGASEADRRHASPVGDVEPDSRTAQGRASARRK